MMASAQAMEEELQQSVMLSEDDAGYETADTAGNGSTITAAPQNVDDGAGGGATAGTAIGAENYVMEDDEPLTDLDASGEEVDEDAEGEEEYDVASPNGITVGGGNEEEEDEEEDDAEGDAEGEDEDEEEGIGAVKIKPEESDDQDDAESDVSELPSVDEESEDEDEEVPWNETNGVDEDEEESEAGLPNTCIFCKEDEENDPSEDFEAFLTCSACGNNAHQQCARDAAAMSERNSPNRWKCPNCSNDDSEVETSQEQDEDDLSIAGDVRPVSQHADIPKDLLPSQRGKVDPEAHSVFNELVLGEDTMDGSRMLRKRKTSSIEADDSILLLRKRRRHDSEDALSSHDDAADEIRAGDSARQHTARTLRLKVSRPLPVIVEKRSRTSMVLKIQVRPGNLKEILSRKKRDKRRGGGAIPKLSRTPVARSSLAAELTPIPIHALPTPFTSDSYSQPYYSLFDKDTEESKSKPYGGILSEAEADTSKTLPMPEDRRRFDQSKQKAEDEWRARILAMQAEAEIPIRRPKKISENASQIECIEFGGWEIDTWYAAPYPAEYSRNRVLYICEFCLKYMNSDYVAWRHKLKCATKHPPGDEIYRHGSVSIFEVDGRKNPVYCQNLCLLAKLFLGSKTLYYDVEPFLFYVLCEYDDCGYHFVGYFSKEKRASSQNNVSCILTLPIHQRKGYGNLLIDFSYLLTKVEEKTGSPEKPLSDMGLVSYRNYWRLLLCQYLLDVFESDDDKKVGLSIKSISDETGMTPDDVIAALEGLRALVRDPHTKHYAFRIDLDYCRQYVSKWEAKGYVHLKPEALAWTPYVMGRSNAVNFELGPPINTIAPREDDEARIEEGPNSVGAANRRAVHGDGEERDSQLEADKDLDAEQTNGEPGSEPLKSIEKVASEEKEDESEEDTIMRDLDPDDPDSWALAYKDIPASRFEVFPPISGTRRADRPRPSASRPSMARTGSSGSRPRRSGGSSSIRRPRPSRPKSSTSRRKSGGTGRGPGRWPKGTKKSDYGNADSGPGLPPGWVEKHVGMTALIEGQDPGMLMADAEDEPTEDSVQVFVSAEAADENHVNGVGGAKSGLKVNGGQGSDVDEDEDDEEEVAVEDEEEEEEEEEENDDEDGDEDAEGEDA